MKPNKNKLARVRLNKNKIKNINTVRQNQNIVIHLGKSNRKSHNLRTTNAPIIRRYYAPIPQPSQESFQTNKTLESVGNTLRELKAEQTILRNELNREQQTAKDLNPLSREQTVELNREKQTAKDLNPLSREREDNEINRGIRPMWKDPIFDSPEPDRSGKMSEETWASILQLQPTRKNRPSSEKKAEQVIESLMKKKPK